MHRLTKGGLIVANSQEGWFFSKKSVKEAIRTVRAIISLLPVRVKRDISRRVQTHPKQPSPPKSTIPAQLSATNLPPHPSRPDLTPTHLTSPILIPTGRIRPFLLHDPRGIIIPILFRKRIRRSTFMPLALGFRGDDGCDGGGDDQSFQGRAVGCSQVIYQ